MFQGRAPCRILPTRHFSQAMKICFMSVANDEMLPIVNRRRHTLHRIASHRGELGCGWIIIQNRRQLILVVECCPCVGEWDRIWDRLSQNVAQIRAGIRIQEEVEEEWGGIWVVLVRRRRMRKSCWGKERERRERFNNWERGLVREKKAQDTPPTHDESVWKENIIVRVTGKWGGIFLLLLLPYSDALLLLAGVEEVHFLLNRRTNIKNRFHIYCGHIRNIHNINIGTLWEDLGQNSGASGNWTFYFDKGFLSEKRVFSKNNS